MRSHLVWLLSMVLFILGGYLAARYVLIPYFLPFLLAVALAVLIDPLVDVAERRLRLSRGMAVFTVLVMVIGVLAAGLAWGTAKLVLELAELGRELPETYAWLLEYVDRLPGMFGEISAGLPDPLRAAIDGQLAVLYEGATGFLSAVIGGIRAVPAALTMAAITVMATFFISRDKRLVARYLLGLLPRTWRERAVLAESEVLAATMGFIRAQLTLISLTAALSVAGLVFIGAEYALLLGLLAGILDIFPLIGPGAVYVPWIIYCLFSGNPGTALRLGALFGILVMIRQGVEARVIGERIGIHPLATLVSIYLGFKFFGAAGFIAGPLAAIIVKAVVRSGLIPRPSEPPH